MVSRIELNCPCCHQRCEIFLCTNATFIFLNCPDCSSPLVYDHHCCALVGENQIRQIRDVIRENRTAGGMDPDTVAASARVPVRYAAESAINGGGHGAQAATLTERATISQDDIINLRIELATCFDARSFIDRM